MALTVTNMPRIFKLDQIELNDPNPAWSPEEVVKHYSALYPELTNGSIQEIKRDESGSKPRVIYTMSRNPGRLG